MPSPSEYAVNKSIHNDPDTLASLSPDPPAAQPPQKTGRARSSMNALRHGLTARTVVLPNEDAAAFQAFSKELADSLDAQTPMERQFAQPVADNQWRCSKAMNRPGLIPEMFGRPEAPVVGG